MNPFKVGDKVRYKPGGFGYQNSATVYIVESTDATGVVISKINPYGNVFHIAVYQDIELVPDFSGLDSPLILKSDGNPLGVRVASSEKHKCICKWEDVYAYGCKCKGI